MADKANEMTECSLPIVSVIIPVYNTEKYLRQCLDTVIAQTLKEIEIICIDDGSTDRSLEILHEYQERDNRIIILTQQNKGGGAARNAGLKIAQGKYLLFLDSDDFFEKDMLKKSYDKGEADEADIVIFGGKIFDEKKQKLSNIIVGIPLSTQKNTSVFNYKLLNTNIFITFGWVPWNKLYRTEFIRNHKLQFQELFNANDLAFVCLSLVFAEKITIIYDLLIYYRANQPTNCRAKSYKNPCATYYAVKYLKEQLIKFNLFDDIKESYVNMALEASFASLNKIKAHPESYQILYDYLRLSGFEKLGINSNTEKLINKSWIHNRYLTMNKYSYAETQKKGIISVLYHKYYAYYLRYRIPELCSVLGHYIKSKGVVYSFKLSLERIIAS